MSPLALISFLGIFVILFDAQNVLSRWHRNVVAVGDDSPISDDFTLCITLYGSLDYFSNREWLEKYKDNTLIILGNMPDADLQGWRVHHVTMENPSPPAMIRQAIDDGVVHTKFTVRMDADTITHGDIRKAIGALDASGADVASVKVHLLNKSDSFWTGLQEQEYRMAMLGRHNRPWCLSGAFFIVRTTLLQKIYHRHTCWFFGEDSETGIVAKRMKAKILHLDFEVLTEAPSSLRALVKQRRAWWAGSFRQSWVNFPHMIRYPLWLIYNVSLVWLALYSKVWELSHLSHVLPVIFVIYIAVTYVANWQVKSDWIIVFPFYATAQSVIMPLYGAGYYFYLAIKHRTSGRYRLPYLGKVV